jgi:hypothetical protein
MRAAVRARSRPFAQSCCFQGFRPKRANASEPERTPNPCHSCHGIWRRSRTPRPSPRPAHAPTRVEPTRTWAVGLALWFDARWTPRHELLAAGGPPDHPANQSAPAVCERREHVPALVAAHARCRGGAVARVALGKAPDLRHPTSFAPILLRAPRCEDRPLAGMATTCVEEPASGECAQVDRDHSPPDPRAEPALVADSAAAAAVDGYAGYDGHQSLPAWPRSRGFYVRVTLETSLHLLLERRTP